MIDILLVEDADTGQWIAQGMNIDYCASGASVEDARMNFWHGLAQTFWENQQRFGTVERVMRKPRPGTLDRLARRSAQTVNGE